MSYFYEFSDAPCGWGLDASITPGLPNSYSWATLKNIQLTQGGDGNHAVGQGYEQTWFPVIRCFWHVRNVKNYASGIPNTEQPVLNFGFAGNVFMSKAHWEEGVW